MIIDNLIRGLVPSIGGYTPVGASSAIIADPDRLRPLRRRRRTAPARLRRRIRRSGRSPRGTSRRHVSHVEGRRHPEAVRRGAGARRLHRSRSSAVGCSVSSGRTAPARRRRCARSSGSSNPTAAICSGTAGRSRWRSGFGSATCRRSAASIRVCRSPSSSPTSAACTGCRRAPPRAAADDWLDRLGVAARASAKVEELSHGNQQRVQLAAALLHEPELLVLDEPFAGLDPVAVHTLADVLRGEAVRGAAVVFSSHQLELVEDICQEVAIIDHGRIVATGDLDALRRRSHRRRIELQLEGAPAAMAAARRGCRAGRAPQRRSAATA